MDIEEIKIRCNNLFNLIEEIDNEILNFLKKHGNTSYLSTLYRKFCYGSDISEFHFGQLFILPLINQGKIKKEEVHNYHYFYNDDYVIKLIEDIGSDVI